MAKIYDNITELIGKTPLLLLDRFAKKHGAQARILAKLEFFNPMSSVKDRAALSMIDAAEAEGKLHAGSTIVEPTSGNTGIGLSYIAASRGYRIVLVMPDTMSIERRKLLSALGAKIVLTAGTEGMSGAIAKAQELTGSIEGAFMPMQFDNNANSAAHFNTTGPEIWDDTDGEVDVFVAGVGTGGTITGVGEYLKARKAVKIVAVEPSSSPVLSGGRSGPNKIQGIGAGFVPKVLNCAIIDEIMPIRSEDAYAITRELAATEGVLVGISAGAALFAALEQGKREENRGKTIVVLLPDTGERYLSTDLFEDQ